MIYIICSKVYILSAKEKTRERERERVSIDIYMYNSLYTIGYIVHNTKLASCRMVKSRE